MSYQSKYFSKEVKPPIGWDQESFWWAVEKLERYGNDNNLFDLAWSLGIKFDPSLKGKVKIVELMIVILNEGGSKETVIKAIKEFCDALP